MTRAALLATLALAVGACGGGSTATEAGGGAAADVTVVDLAGLDRALASQRGHAVLLNFWATWCVPCVDELPDLVAVARARREHGLAVLLVSYDLQVPDADRVSDVAKVRRFVESRQFDLPVLVYDAPDQKSINERFALPGYVPVTLAFDGDGREVGRAEGEADRARFEELARAALGI